MKDRDASQDRPSGESSETCATCSEDREDFRGSAHHDRVICDHTPALIHCIDETGRLTGVNEYWLQSLGYERHEVVGRLFTDFLAENCRKLALKRYLPEIFGSGGAKVLSCQFLKKSGEIVDVVLSATAKTGSEGRYAESLFVALDVTERQKALADVIEGKEQWERTFDAVPDLIMILDRSHQIIRANKATAEKFGLTKEDLIGTRCHEVFHCTQIPPTFCPWVCCQADGIMHEVEVFEQRVQGTFFVSVNPLWAADGTLMGCVHVARDITERKRAEERLQQLNEEIRMFAYIVSHDLRAPLANVNGFCRELESAMSVILPAVQASMDQSPDDAASGVRVALEEDLPESLAFIKSSVSRMDHLVNAILKLSRLGRSELRFESLDMNELVTDTVNTLAHQISSKGAQVTVNPLPAVVADLTAMEQIMGNLLENAIKYLDAARPGCITVSGGSQGPETVFQIRDNGIGIRATDVERMFQIFQRGRTVDVPGEGMGLAYVQTLVRRHGGTISCESEPGQGSTFTFTIAHHL